MAAQHTPGPWFLVGEDDLPKIDDLMVVALDVAAPGEEPDELFICNVGSNGGEYSTWAPVDAGERWPVSLANARLIAAAPELLAAAKSLLDEYEVPTEKDGMRFRADRLHQAIAKAEGR